MDKNGKKVVWAEKRSSKCIHPHPQNSDYSYMVKELLSQYCPFDSSYIQEYLSFGVIAFEKLTRECTLFCRITGPGYLIRDKC